MLGIELITTTCGEVYNGITDDETCREPESEPIVCLRYWDCCLVVSPHACFRALPCARFPVFLVGLVIRTAGSDLTVSFHHEFVQKRKIEKMKKRQEKHEKQRKRGLKGVPQSRETAQQVVFFCRPCF